MTHPVNCIITNADTTTTDNTALGEEDALRRVARAREVWEHTNERAYRVTEQLVQNLPLTLI